MTGPTPRVIPCLLLQDRKLVKTTGFADADYVGDPVNVLSIFNSFEVDEIVMLDIGAAKRRTPCPDDVLLRCAEECFIPLAYGGGLTDVAAMERVFSIGYEKVVLNSVVADDPDVVRQASERFGSQAVVVAIDVRGSNGDWRVHTHGGSRPHDFGPIEWAQRAEQLGAGEILLTSIDREGSMAGYDLDLVRAVVDAVAVPVIAHGGAAKRRDLGRAIHEGGAHAAAAGSLFVYQGAHRGVLINYPTRAQLLRILTPEAAL